jgi:NtrC-family two-component system sensor histidine kinase KinB
MLSLFEGCLLVVSTALLIVVFTSRYRLLQAQRLLVEKRRADIIAASISDGIFLLKREEILYSNPVGERILASAAGKRAVLSAVFQTIPVEHSVDAEGRKNYYLIQAAPVPSDSLKTFALPKKLRKANPFEPDTIVIAQDMTIVRESQEAKGHFLATLSHEVKTPVTSLVLATRLLRKSVDQFANPTHRALIMTCAEDVDRLRGLLDELMTVSRFDVLTQRLQLQSADLGKLVRQAVQSVRQSATEKNVEMTVKTGLPKQPIAVMIDPAKIAWALSNLLTNAVRHTPRGGKVEVVAELNSNQSVEVKVIDQGPGIDKKRQDKIFDRFNSFYDIRVARTGGAGVGLAIAREIIQAHGGRIWVVSEPGQGAKFCFTLPLANHNQVQGGGRMITMMKGASNGATARS